MMPALLVQKVDNTIHWIYLYSVDRAIGFCIVIFLEDLALIKLLNNWGLVYIACIYTVKPA